MSEEVVTVTNGEVVDPGNKERRPANRKDVVKNVAIGFLSVMLVLTFFSNTIMNFSLPQVATKQITSGTISPQIRGTGTVSAEDPYNVTVNETRKISSVAVKEGDKIEKDDVIYYLEDKESSELTEAKERLEDLELSYEQTLFSGSIPNDVISRVRGGRTMTYDSYQAELKDVNDRYDAAEKAVKDIDAVIQYLNTSKTIDTNEIAYNEITPDYTDAQADLDAAQTNAQKSSSEESLSRANNRQSSIRELISLKTELDQMSDDDVDYEARKNEYEAAKKAYEYAYGSVDDLQKELNYVNQKVIDLERKTSSYDEILANLENIKNINSRDKAQLAAYANQLGISYDQKIAKAEQVKAEAQVVFDDVKDEKDELLTSINTEISLCDQRDKIAKQREKVEELEKDSVGATIKAPVKGTISELNKVAGETTSAEETVAVIQIDGKDMTTSFSVTNAQAQKLKVGDFAVPQNVWQFSEDFKATLTSIKNDKSDPGNKKVLTFKIDSKEVTPGQSLSLAIGERSVDYDLVVPNSAIKSDSNGKFILVVTSKSSPLGNRYMASRVDVTVKAQDDNNTAISAAVEGDEYVITTSTSMVKAGDQVRLAEE
jgi:multidrug efflux pump subunit AcrA (membrane-fusion protein)